MMRTSLFNPSVRRRGFSLLELVVVIGIILLLVALTLAVGTAIARGAEVRETENTMKLLTSAVEEWEDRLAQRKVTRGTNDTPVRANYDMKAHGTTPSRPYTFSIAELLNVIGKPADVQAITGQINPVFVYKIDTSATPTPPVPAWVSTATGANDDPFANLVLTQYNSGAWNGSLVILDAWDLPIRVIHPGHVVDNTLAAGIFGDPVTPIDADGTVRTHEERRYGVCVSRKICFVSAGPDGKFGNLHVGVANPNAAQQADIKLAEDNVYSYAVLKR